jgi:MerR family copper efflux transcriptional regulator
MNQPAESCESGVDVPIVCTLDGSAMPARLEDWQAVLRHVTVRAAIPDGLRLGFGADAPLGEMAMLAAAEHECCAFFRFAITVDERGVALEVTAPTDAQPLIDELFGAASSA